MLRRWLFFLLSWPIAFGFFASGRAEATPEQSALRTLQVTATSEYIRYAQYKSGSYQHQHPKVTATSESGSHLGTFPIVVTVKKSANVRAGPGTEYPVISGARAGQRLSVVGCNQDCSWYQLAEDCWIAAFLVKPEQPLAPQVPTGGGALPEVVVRIPITVPGAIVQTTRCPQTVAQVNTYAGPGTFYAVVDTRPPGECVAVVGRNTVGDWLQLSHGMWMAAAVILYAEPIEILPITEPTATPTSTINAVNELHLKATADASQAQREEVDATREAEWQATIDVCDAMEQAIGATYETI